MASNFRYQSMNLSQRMPFGDPNRRPAQVPAATESGLLIQVEQCSPCVNSSGLIRLCLVLHVCLKSAFTCNINFFEGILYIFLSQTLHFCCAAWSQEIQILKRMVTEKEYPFSYDICTEICMYLHIICTCFTRSHVYVHRYIQKRSIFRLDALTATC